MQLSQGCRIRRSAKLVRFAAVAWLLGVGATVDAARESNISATRHNLSSLSGNSTSSTETDEVCVFCHTPHGANISVAAPLWNRVDSNVNGTYSAYYSGSIDAYVDTDNPQPVGNSKLCLSCHDGTVAVGSVTNQPGSGAVSNADADSNGWLNITREEEGGSIPEGLGKTTGFTRRIGTDLSNDHPISFEYTTTLAVDDDGELVDSGVPDTGGGKVGGSDHIVVTAPVGEGVTGSVTKAGPGQLPLQHLDGEALMQCTTCHDPHLSDPDAEAAGVSIKFLRQNRFQDEAGALAGDGNTNAAAAKPIEDTFRVQHDITCLSCHKKAGWADSAHAVPLVADEPYQADAAALREFPDGMHVWQASCLNCHDTHTVQGSRRLLREGVDAVPNLTGSAPYMDGFADADYNTASGIQNTCFQCHRDAANDGSNAVTAATGIVPSIKSLFDLPYGMPVDTADQAHGTREVHDITDADLLESRETLGYGINGENHDNRHAECTDCHNPHRLRRQSRFDGESAATGDGALRTHKAGGPFGNVASGVLRGSWGVEPTYFADKDTTTWAGKWPWFPDDFAVKKGDPGDYTLSSVVATARVQTETAGAPLTREYQLCFKCHSNYSNGEAPSEFVPLEYTIMGCTGRRCTPTNMANGLTRYTNVAAEFLSVRATDPPSSGGDQGEHDNSSENRGDACTATGGSAVGGGDAGDCDPAPGTAPDGYANDTYNHRSWHPVVYPTGRDRAERNISLTSTTINLRPPYVANIGTQTMHCSDCHGQGASWQQNTGPLADLPQGPHGSEYPFLLRGRWDTGVTISNASSTTTQRLCGNCHNPEDGSSGYSSSHRADGEMSGMPCMDCHVAVPHGWKNKAFLVNLRCVGTEVGRTASGWSATEKSSPTECDDYGNYSSRLDEPPYYYRSILRVSSWQRSGNWGGESACGGGSMTDGSC